MQLDLFEDNRPNILLNIVDEHLRARELGKALVLCEQVRDKYPDNRHASELCMLIEKWHAYISEIDTPSFNPQQLKDLLIKLESVVHMALRTAVVETLVDILQTLSEPDFVFIPPRFHRGHLLLELGRFADATVSFRTALTSPNLEQGRFLAWSADAMTLAGNSEDAICIYQKAFVDDPATVDMPFIKHKTILELYQHCSQHADGINDEGEVAWLPVWGWLQSVFSLPIQNPPDFEQLESQIGTSIVPIPRLWYNLLIRAEYLRTVQRDDPQSTSVRRLMKRVNEEMFECYMQKIRRTKQ